MLHDEDLENDNVGIATRVESTDGEHIVRLCRHVVEGHSVLEIDGTLMDVQTAAAVVKLADNLNPQNRAKFIARRTVISMGVAAQKVCFK